MGELMCPHCGQRFEARKARPLVPRHFLMTCHGERLKAGDECPGSLQVPRNPESDLRPLWKDLPGEQQPAG